MKNKIINISVLIISIFSYSLQVHGQSDSLLLGSPSFIPSDSTTVFWLHGWLGDENAWTKVEDYVENKYKVRCVAPDYSANQDSLQAAALNLKDDLIDLTNVPLSNRHFIIAHSMGGLVVRKMGDINEEMVSVPVELPDGKFTIKWTMPKFYYNGLITFGTPHYGVVAAEKINTVNSVITHFCDALSAGFLYDAVYSNVADQANNAMAMIAPIHLISDGISSAGCPYIGPDVIPKIINLDIAPDLTPSSVQNLDPMPAEHNAVFYGIEDATDESLLPRFVGAVRNSPNDRPLFGADVMDQEGFDFYQDKIDFYSSRIDSVNSIVSGFWENNEKKKKRKSKHRWQRGLKAIKTANSCWENIIGVSNIYYEMEGCICEDQWAGPSYIVDEDDCDVAQSITGDPCEPYFTRINLPDKPSDGFILVESASDAPGRSDRYPPVLMLGSNHMQMRNDSNTRDAMDFIFNDGMNYIFFKKETRD